MVARALLLILSLLNIGIVLISSEKTCYSATHSDDDCVCGMTRKTTVEWCQNEQTYFRPSITQIKNIKCANFSCMNGGVLNEQGNHCECPGSFYGECCEKESYPKGICGDVLLGLSGTIRTLNFGHDQNIPYINNMTCVWRISTDPSLRIALSVKDELFDVEQGDDMYNCRKDRLDIYDGRSTDAVKVGSFCGRGMRKFESLMSTGSDLYLEFHSDDDGRRAGFNLQYTTFLKNSECGPRTVFRLPTGVIESPNHPFPYNSDANCTYEIIALPGHDIVITVLDINMLARANCNEGDKLTLSKTEQGKPETLLTVFCGNEVFSKYTIKNPKSVVINFTSDGQKNGLFKLRYNQEPSMPIS